MTIAHLLEDFGVASTSNILGKFMDEDALEDFRLNSFEQGYAAGWEDSVAAQDKERIRLSASLSNNLEDLSFTYHEAVNQLMESIEPLFRQLLETALPDAFAQTQGHLIVEELLDMAREVTEEPVQIAVPPGAALAVQKILADMKGMRVEVIEDPRLDAGQADIRIGHSMREIDGNRIMARFAEAIDAFFHQIREEAEHG
ncbi:MAG: hypothetical protein AB3N11_17470, partial [Arenibacterium sp.]